MIKLTLEGQEYTIDAGTVTATTAALQWIADIWQREYEFLRDNTTEFASFEDHDLALAHRLAGQFLAITLDLAGHVSSMPAADGRTKY